MHHRGRRAVFAMASASIVFNCAFVNSLGCLFTGFREDTTFWTGRAHAAISGGLRLGTETILGFAVGGLCPCFRPMRNSLAHTASRLCPRRLAICPALWPLTHNFLRRPTLAASHMLVFYTQIATADNIDTLCSIASQQCRSQGTTQNHEAVLSWKSLPVTHCRKERSSVQTID